MTFYRTTAAIALCALATAGTGVAQERRISRSALPAPVDAAVTKTSEGAKIRGFSEETEGGQVLYEAELIVDGRSKDILFNASGEIVEVEQEVPMKELPASVMAGLRAKTGKGKITHVESLTKGGVLVAYEAQVVIGGRHSEVQVGPNGESLDHEE